MKIWFDYCRIYGDLDNDVKFGIGWYRHSKDHKWFGFTINVYLFPWNVFVNFVSNYKEYDKRINYWRHKKDKK